MVCVEVPGIQHLIYPGFRSVRKLPPAGRSEMTYMRCDLNRSMQHQYSNTTEEDVEYEKSLEPKATSLQVCSNGGIRLRPQPVNSKPTLQILEQAPPKRQAGRSNRLGDVIIYTLVEHISAIASC